MGNGANNSATFTQPPDGKMKRTLHFGNLWQAERPFGRLNLHDSPQLSGRPTHVQSVTFIRVSVRALTRGGDVQALNHYRRPARLTPEMEPRWGELTGRFVHGAHDGRNRWISSTEVIGAVPEPARE